MIWLSETDNTFPTLEHVTDDGVLALGGDLSPERLKLAYSQGIFPWYSEGDPIIWYCPNPRMVLFLDQLKISKSMQKIIRQQVLP